MSTSPLRIVADLGNSRLKWGRLGFDGRLASAPSLPIDDPAAWIQAWAGLDGQSAWAISSVNPPASERLDAILVEQRIASIRWFRSAADVPVPHALATPQTTGADRAWAVRAAIGLNPAGTPGLVVSCGTAVTVERIGPGGVWQGGAIAPGLATAARALNRATAQLPEVAVAEAPPAWGPATDAALAAGVFWGTVGAISELLRRQAEGLEPAPWLVATGGDADRLAPWIDAGLQVVPDLVLVGLAAWLAEEGP